MIVGSHSGTSPLLIVLKAFRTDASKSSMLSISRVGKDASCRIVSTSCHRRSTDPASGTETVMSTSLRPPATNAPNWAANSEDACS